MPVGDHSGSTIIKPAVKDERGRIVQPEKIYARKRYKDPITGKRREKKRLVETRTEAREKHDELKAEIQTDRLKLVQIEQHTFKDLAKFYKKEYLKPARYVRDVRVEGLRSWKRLQGFLRVLEREFDSALLSEIDYERIARFKKKRLATPVVITKSKKKIAAGGLKTRPRGVTSLHRELELLRRMLEIARRRLKWISHNPFQDGSEPLIQRSLEQERMLILSRQQEKNLLAACVEPRAHLRLALLWAIDTAMRPSEQFTCAVSDVHLKERYIVVTSRRAKRERRRIVPMTARLAGELKRHLGNNAKPSDLVFEFDRNKRSFATACRLAGLKGVRWQDLRHTGIMRMLDATKDSAKVKKVTGHTNDTTFMRYVNLNPELAREIGRAMDQRSRRA
jgi:integrase